jgi:GTP-binding protein
MARPIVAIVGRQNVGKSTLFNRIIGRRLAVVDDLPGVTRDRNDAIGDWSGREFRLVDTGGLLPEARSGLDARVRGQVETAVGTADLVLLVVDATVGPVPLDAQIADVIRRSGRAFQLVANKTESEQRQIDAFEFARLGLGDPIAVSALHGTGVGDLLDRVVELLPPESRLRDDPDAVRVAIVGRPNVGKSSIVNRLLGEERMIVDDAAGTTRDAIDSEWEWEGRRIVLVDTAGLRRRTQIDTRTEYYCTVRAWRALERCDVAVQVIDTSQPFSRQDYRISSAVVDSLRPAVLVFNKWDLVDKETLTSKHMEASYREHAHDLWYAPSVFVSALSGQRITRIPPMLLQGYREARRRIGGDRIMAVLEEAVTATAPPAGERGRPVRFRRARQVTANPIRIAIETTQPESLPVSYQRYLLRRLREGLGIQYAPLRLELRRPERRRRRPSTSGAG